MNPGEENQCWMCGHPTELSYISTVESDTSKKLHKSQSMFCKNILCPALYKGGNDTFSEMDVYEKSQEHFRKKEPYSGYGKYGSWRRIPPMHLPVFMPLNVKHVESDTRSINACKYCKHYGHCDADEYHHQRDHGSSDNYDTRCDSNEPASS
ncbi:MAG TPA: hypothetical protein VKM55_00970 [Candidatus Lokiarchaeia archaeon]|nr:hypothetical protein [Candidatus Lokiarchaeia archaeon]